MVCEKSGILYNSLDFRAFVLQAKKKPLVTLLLAECRYAWGWRCELNYDQVLFFGQVFPNSIANGSGYTAMVQPKAQPHLQLQPKNWIALRDAPEFALLSGLLSFRGAARALRLILEKQKARYWQYLAS